MISQFSALIKLFRVCLLRLRNVHTHAHAHAHPHLHAQAHTHSVFEKLAATLPHLISVSTASVEASSDKVSCVVVVRSRFVQHVASSDPVLSHMEGVNVQQRQTCLLLYMSVKFNGL